LVCGWGILVVRVISRRSCTFLAVGCIGEVVRIGVTVGLCLIHADVFVKGWKTTVAAVREWEAVVGPRKRLLGVAVDIE
jgi:hypothetical protein